MTKEMFVNMNFGHKKQSGNTQLLPKVIKDDRCQVWISLSNSKTNGNAKT